MDPKKPAPKSATVTEEDKTPKPFPNGPTFPDSHRKVTVICRVRPMNTYAGSAGKANDEGAPAVTATGKRDAPPTRLIAAHPNIVLSAHRKSLISGKTSRDETKYTFDYVFGGGGGGGGGEEGTTTTNSHTNSFIYSTLGLTEHFVDVAIGQGVSCAVAFGATGSGKTHTMMGSAAADDGGEESASAQPAAAAALGDAGLIPLALKSLFERIAALQQQNDWRFSVSLSAVEIAGKSVTDLLLSSGSGGRTPAPAAPATATRHACDVKEDDLGRAYVAHCAALAVPDAARGAELLRKAAARRRTSATFRNNTSSRTHAVFIFRIRNESMPLADEGQMLFVDLAGSEAAYDKTTHDAETLKETALINKSLATLKECLRARASISASGAHVHVPYRSDKLTLLLKALFEPATATPSATVLCCCVSPLAADAGPHSSHSLKYMAPMRAALANAGRIEHNPADPSCWDAAQTSEFLRNVSGGKLSPRAFAERPEGLSGRQLISLSQQEFIRRCCAASNATMEEAIHYFGELWELGSAARDVRRHAVERSAATVALMSRNSADEEAALMDSIEAERAMYERYRAAKLAGCADTMAECLREMGASQ